MTDSAEIDVYSGREQVGLIKTVRGGFECFAIGPDHEPVYLAKAASRKEASDLIHAHAAGLKPASVMTSADHADR